MSDQVTPQPGDVWKNGEEIRFMVANDGELTWRALDDDYFFFSDDPEWMVGAVLIFRNGKPVPAPQPEGETTHGQSHCLDVDHFERIRSLHRVVRALHDGECPSCHKISNSERVRQINRNECPHCRFTITADEMNAVAKEFAPVMEKNLAVFEEWRRRGVLPSVTVGDGETGL